VARGGLDVGSLDEGHIEAFLQSASSRRKTLKRAGEARRLNWRRPLRLFLQELRRSELGLTCASSSPLPSNHPIVAGFAAYLESQQGLGTRIILQYTRWLERLLQHVGIQTTDGIRDLSAAQIDSFLINVTRGLARCTVNTICCGIRAFLRYAHVRGLRDQDLSFAVGMPRIYALERLPRFIAWGDIERTLASVDLTTLLGCRDHAILILLARCGLRGGEVAALQIDQIDWRHDTIRLRRPKSNTTENIPLVPVVGEALLQYTRRRPVVPFAELFLKVLAPIGPMSSPGIGQVVKAHLKRAGVQAPHWGSHTLRHSFAVELLRRGFPLKTIGDTLGHHHPESTFIYTKTAVEDLREGCLAVQGVLP
jgi:integrase/recombinase XerD